MHSKIIQMERNPITKADCICASDVEDGFVGRIADYVVPQEKKYIPQIIHNVFGVGDIFELNEGDMTVVVKDKKKYFEMKFEIFKHRLKKIYENVSLDTFSNPPGKDSDLEYDLYACNAAYDDKYSVYIFDNEYGDLVTMDEWMRWANDNDKFYIGGILDYHF